MANLSVYSERDYRHFLSAHLQFLRGLCELSIHTVDQSVQQSLSSLLISKQLLSEEAFHFSVDSMINETKLNAPPTLLRLLSLLQATNHGNAIVSAYGTNYQYIPLVFNLNLNNLYTQAIIYNDNCSCQLNFTCTFPASFIEMESVEPVTLKGLRMGCTPSESFLASTLECFYDLSCINLIQQIINNNTHMNDIVFPAPLDINNSRFLANMTVTDLMNDLFVEQWLSTVNYSSYFNHCSPMLCSYIYTQQLNSVYTITYFLSLYGGLTIVLKWIAPKIVYLVNKIYQRRKKRTCSIQPTTTIEIATLEIINSKGIDNITTFSESAPTVATQNQFSVSSKCWIIGSTVFILVTIIVLIPALYIMQQRKNHPA